MNEGHRDWPAAIFGKDNFHGVGSLLMGTGCVAEAGDAEVAHLVQARTRGLSLPVSGSVDQARTSRRRAKSPVLGARGEARPGGNKGESNIV